MQKTRNKTVLCMTGPFKAHETILYCKKCGSVCQSKALKELVGKHCNVSWDLLVFVGRSLFQRYQTVNRICRDLETRNIKLSPSEIEYLGRKFIMLLARAHRQAAPRIEQAMQRSGGYILHLDATHEGDAPALMTGMDSLRQIVLANVKIPSEHADHIVPFLQQLKRDYGCPIACVHDMGAGICKAVPLVFPGTRDFVCHFHFLRDAGKDLLDSSYGQLRKTLQEHGASTRLNELVRDVRKRINLKIVDATQLECAINNKHIITNAEQKILISIYSLALWCLQGKKEGNGYGFPFDRPILAFACRILELKDSLPLINEQIPKEERVGNRLFCKFTQLIQKISADPNFTWAINDLKWRGQLFDKLRKNMRIAEPEGRNGLNDDGGDKSMSSIRSGVRKFRSELDENPKYADDTLCIKLAIQIDKYNDKLFADPIEVDASSGKVTLYPQRTNNMLEQFFRGLRRGHRRKTGDNSMKKALHAMLADSPLVKNLDKPEYMKILLNGKGSLEELFAELGAVDYNELKSNPGLDRILPGFRKVMKMKALPKKIQLMMESDAA
ncbi:transposase [Desulfobacula sp.]|uniref:transposase n=1 Tax=Desulfobacula sp. TaxID=2593537 RepID=UPI0039B925A0